MTKVEEAGSRYHNPGENNNMASVVPRVGQNNKMAGGDSIKFYVLIVDEL